MIKKLFKWLFITKDGKVVIGQLPNLPIILWLVSLIINNFVKDYKINWVISLVGTISLVYWAILEITRGVNGFRRLLGLGVITFIFILSLSKL